MNLSKLGKLLVASNWVSGSLLQVKAKAVKAVASVHWFFATRAHVIPMTAP